MKMKSYFKYLLALLILSFCVVISFYMFKSKHENENNTEVTTFSDKVFSIKGFTVSNYSKGQIIYSISCDELEVSPKKIGIFKIRIYNEFKINNANIKNFRLEQNDKVEIFQLGDIGPITRGLVDRFEWTIHDKSEPVFSISAEKAKLDKAKRKTTLTNAIIRHIPSGEKIACRTVVFDEKSQIFLIPGSFLKETKNKREIGKFIQIDLHYNQSALR